MVGQSPGVRTVDVSGDVFQNAGSGPGSVGCQQFAASRTQSSLKQQRTRIRREELIQERSAIQHGNRSGNRPVGYPDPTVTSEPSTVEKNLVTDSAGPAKHPPLRSRIRVSHSNCASNGSI